MQSPVSCCMGCPQSQVLPNLPFRGEGLRTCGQKVTTTSRHEPLKQRTSTTRTVSKAHTSSQQHPHELTIRFMQTENKVNALLMDKQLHY